MTSKRILSIIGIFLVIIQIVAFIGKSKVYVGLYPENEDLYLSSPYTFQSELNAKKAFFAVKAGFDRFASSFGDLTYSKYEYRDITEQQYASAMIRESLGNSTGLLIYDTILTISYCFTGLLGIGFLILASKEE